MHSHIRIMDNQNGESFIADSEGVRQWESMRERKEAERSLWALVFILLKWCSFSKD